MELPADLQQRLAAALAEMRADPAHQLRPYRRQAIYGAFGRLDDPIADRARGWLGVLAARRVLPIWEAAIPMIAAGLKARYGPNGEYMADEDLDLPRQALSEIESIATRVIPGLRGFSAVLEDFYQTQHVKGVPIPTNSQRAQSAVYHAQPWGKYFRGFFYGYTVTPRDNDINLSYNDFDAAGHALWAFAGSDTLFVDYMEKPKHPPDPAKSQEFWEWWLQEAVPRAWELAHSPR